MSIPVTIDPLGTLGGGGGLEFVQPKMRSNTVWEEPLAVGSCGMTLEFVSENASFNYKVFNTRDHGLQYWQREAEINVFVHFEKPVKVSKVQDSFHVALIGSTTMTLYRDDKLVAGPVSYKHRILGEVEVSAPAYSKEYRLKFETDASGWCGIGKIDILGEIK